MSSSEFTDAACWGGKPVARRIADARPRQRVVVSGTIRESRTVPLRHSQAYSCVLSDGSGEIGLIFVGRHTVPGMAPGILCTVEGTARMVGTRLEIWNPLYRLEPESVA